MKIRTIYTFPLILPISEVYGGAAGFLEDCRTLIIRLETDVGIAGWGEATQGRPGNTYETLETMDVMVRKYFAPALAGMDLELTGEVLAKLHTARAGHPIAKAGLETAIWDALAKSCGLPLYRILGPLQRKEIDLVGGLGMDLSAETIGAKAAQLRRSGYQTFKLKIGHKDLQQDVARVRAVREAVGSVAAIRVDGNATYSLADARQILTALIPYNVADAEQPLARGDLASLAELRRTVGVPIAAQESVAGPEDALAVLQANAADLLKIKLTHIGGFQRARGTAAIFAAKNLSVVIGQGSACTPILSAAEMHLHAVLPNAQPAGEMTGFLRLGEQDIFTPIQVQRGRATLSNSAGLGIDVDVDRLARAARPA